ncbi:putative membrane protein [Gottschalkia purinilytica]|uniref:Putative membrane protein n=1 Tax=Gottschalkia purinilytica TaxID=1503 RepID=A0A0L0WBL7_GOTPU|nr:DUF116 domain-containing protein [Gottschalkia purinilytica]KNF08740.1 putative membrane protein [Gottschalkia purinilytica]
MKNDEKVFIVTANLIILSLLLLSIVGIMFIVNKSIITLQIILLIVIILALSYTISIVLSLFILHRIANNKKISRFSYRFLSKIMGAIYPLLLFVAKVMKKDKDSIRRVHARVNNLLVTANPVEVTNKDILILLPHCLQDSNCKVKITHDINNCKLCGKCDIEKILEVSRKYNVKVIVATGGTLAREWIKRIKPKCIIAVACERDLSSGINDVKKIPVLGIINDRPNGSCFNTKVSIDKLEEAIKFFLKEDV